MPVLRQEKKNRWEKVPVIFPAMLNLKNGHPVILEIGPGRGDFLFHLSEKYPHSEIIAVELKSKRFFKLIERRQKRSLTNVRLIQADAKKALKKLFSPSTINEIHINFPDPWPKRQHSKNRLINKEFILDCLKMLVKNGQLSIITDSKNYADEIKKAVSAVSFFEPLEPDSNEPFPTYFALKWRKEGRDFFWQRWKKLENISPMLYANFPG